MKYKHDNKTYKLPDTLAFPINMRCFYTAEYRTPRKGEFYLSANLMKLNTAFNTLKDEFIVVKPTHRAITPRTVYTRGPAISL